MPRGQDTAHHPARKVARPAPVDDWNPEEDGPQNDDWIHGAYLNQAESRDAGLLDEY